MCTNVCVCVCDVRWNVIRDAVDCRTREERGLTVSNLTHRDGVKYYGTCT